MVTREHDFKKFPELTNNQLDEQQLLSPHVQITEDFEGVVVKVHDGDTISLSTSFRDFTTKLRMVGLDAPELSDGGHVARDWLSALILNQKVFVSVDGKNRVDKYGRLLGRVFYGGLDVGQQEIVLGLAPPFDERGEEIDPIEKSLSREALGLIYEFQ